MQAFLVRLKRNQELVGIFLTPTEDELWQYVDEATDVDACECLELPPGGFYFPHSGAPRVPTLICDPNDESSFPDWFSNALVSELWDDIMYSDKHEPDWRPVE